MVWVRLRVSGCQDGDVGREIAVVMKLYTVDGLPDQHKNKQRLRGFNHNTARVITGQGGRKA